MNFSLDYFELQFDEHLILAGEHLFEQGGVQHITPLEAGLFGVIVQDDARFEVEVLMSGQRVKKTVCECPLHRSDGRCTHVVTALFALRAWRREAENTAKQRSAANKTLTTAAVIADIPDDDLRRFLRRYASRDKRFAMALKTRFARHVETVDNAIKYTQLLNGVVRPLKSANERYALSTVRLLAETVKELYRQFDDAQALQQYREALNMLGACLTKLYYVIYHSPERSTILEPLVRRGLSLLDTLLRSPVAPELKAEGLQYLMDLLSRSYYQVRFDDVNVSTLIYQHGLDTAYSAELQAILGDRLSDLKLTPKSRLHLLVLWLLLFPSEDNDQLADQLERTPPELIFRLIDTLAYRESKTEALRVLDLARSRNLISAQHAIDKKIELLAFFQEDEWLRQLAVEQLLKTGRIQYYDWLHSNPTLDTDKRLAIVHEHMDVDDPGRLRLLCDIYALEEQAPLILNLLAKHGTIESALPYLSALLPMHDTGLRDLLRTLVDRAVNQRAGAAVNRSVSELIRRLRQLQADRIADHLLQYLTSNHAHRHTLLKELADF